MIFNIVNQECKCVSLNERKQKSVVNFVEKWLEFGMHQAKMLRFDI